MAFKDANGKITIDEVAAQKDISNINAAITDLTEAKASLTEIMYQAQSFEGKTAIAIGDSSATLINEYEKMIEQLVDTKAMISNTVEKYRRIDERLANQMNNQG